MDENKFDSFASGIRIIGDDVARFRTDDAIELSVGIIPAKAQYGSLGYWENAFVPKLPWRKPSARELDLLLGSIKGVGPGNWIQIVKFPAEIYGLFEGARTASRERSDQKLREYVTRSECREAIKKTIGHAGTLTWPEHGQVERGAVFFKAAGLPTTTPRNYPELLGLHIDTAYKNVPFAERKYAPGRLSLNLGLDDRFLLFVNIGVEQIQRALADRNISCRDEQANATHQFRAAFMSAFPEYPVVKVRVCPGEGYIAPTENMIHDGCTIGQTHFDVQFSACGHFQPQCSLVGSVCESWCSRLKKNEVASPLRLPY
jgi:hypothetical protein